MEKMKKTNCRAGQEKRNLFRKRFLGFIAFHPWKCRDDQPLLCDDRKIKVIIQASYDDSGGVNVLYPPPAHLQFVSVWQQERLKRKTYRKEREWQKVAKIRKQKGA